MKILWTTLIVGVGCAVPLGASPQGSDADEYMIGARDLVEVRVFEEPTLNVERRVEGDGTIDLPLLGTLSIAGKTEREAASELRSLLEESYLQRATVSVQVREFRARPISILGAVKRPGQLDLSGRTTLLEAITEAGGLAENHAGTVEIQRRAENGLADTITIEITDLVDRGDPAVNLPIFAEDMIRVPPAREITVLFMGEVAVRGAVTIGGAGQPTLLSAIARAGGLTDRASNRILVKRRGQDGRLVEIRANYKAILSGRQPDLPLEEGDLILVKESFL